MSLTLRKKVEKSMNEIEKLANQLDALDDNFKKDPKDRSDPLWTSFVGQKDTIVHKMYGLFPTVPDSFPLSRYLLSSSIGHQTVAVSWSRFKKDSSYLNVLCYMLLNSSSNFLTYHILLALADVMDQCDYQQLSQIEQTLVSFAPPRETSRYNTKKRLLKIIEPQMEFSISDIVQNSYWWRDVESKFFNSLAGTSQYRLRHLQIIRNRQLFEQFHAYRDQLGENDKILFVYHGSTPQSLQAIAKQGFLEAHMLAHISTLDPGYFGRGIYQGFAADYAIHYSEHYKKSDEILLSMVSPGRSYTVKKGGEKYGGDREPGFDSHISPESKEIVLFQSAQILPLFVIRFEKIPNQQIREEPL